MNKGTAHCTVFWKQCARGSCVSGVREASPPSSGPRCTGWTRNGRSRTNSDAQAGLSRELAVSVGCADPGCRKSRCNRGVFDGICMYLDGSTSRPMGHLQGLVHDRLVREWENGSAGSALEGAGCRRTKPTALLISLLQGCFQTTQVEVFSNFLPWPSRQAVQRTLARCREPSASPP